MEKEQEGMSAMSINNSPQESFIKKSSSLLPADTHTRKRKKLPAYLTLEEYSRVIKLVRKPHHRLAFNLSFNSGLRISEVVNLQKEDVDLDGKRIFIRNAKGGKDRIVPLPKGFPAKSLELLPLKCGARALEIAFKRVVSSAGVKKNDLRYHSLRHSFAVNCMEKGIPLNHIQALLGHEDISTTGIYLRINPMEALKKYEEVW